MVERNSRAHIRAISFAILGIGVLLISCGGVESEDDSLCGDAGEWDGNQCICDEGYALSEDGSSCLSNDGTSGNSQTNNTAEGDSEPSPLDLVPVEFRASIEQNETGGKRWLYEARSDDKTIAILIDESLENPTDPGGVGFDEDETDYSTCTICIVVAIDCSPQGGGMSCERILMPLAQGQMVLTELGDESGEPLSGHLEGLLLREVEIDVGTYATTTVDGGALRTIDHWEFSAELGDDTSSEVCGGNGHLHNDHCHCDPGYVNDPDDPANCIPG